MMMMILSLVILPRKFPRLLQLLAVERAVLPFLLRPARPLGRE